MTEQKIPDRLILAGTRDVLDDPTGSPSDDVSEIAAIDARVPCTERSLAALEVAELAMRLSDAARALVDRGPSATVPGAVLAGALALRDHLARLTAAAVVAERKYGASWNAIGEAADMARSTAHSTWSSAETAWNTQYFEDVRWRVRGGFGDPGTDAVRRAGRVDEWLAGDAEYGPRARVPGPVTARLEALDPAEEAEQLTRLHDLLFEHDDEPDPESLVALSIRRAEVDEILAAQLPARLARQLRQQAAVARAYAREAIASLPPGVAARYRDRLGTPRTATAPAKHAPTPVLVPPIVRPSTAENATERGGDPAERTQWRSVFEAIDGLGDGELIGRVVESARSVRAGDGGPADELVIAARVLDSRHRGPDLRSAGSKDSPRLSQMRPRGLVADAIEDPPVMTMNMIRGAAGAGFAATTAGFIRERFGADRLAGMSLAILPGVLPEPDTAPVVLYETLNSTVAALLSAIRDGADHEQIAAELVAGLHDRTGR